MTRNGYESKSMPARVAVNTCRIVLGLTFMFSGIVKAVDPMGTQIKISDYMYAFGLGGTLLDSTMLIMACLLAGMELLLGVYMTLGTYVRGTSLLLLMAMAVFTPFTLYLALKNPVEDCGCFGDAVILSNWQTFLKNVFLLLLSVTVFVWKRHVVPFVSEKRQWIVTVVYVLIAVRFMIGNINHLPAIDFRPYKVGTDLRDEVLVKGNPEMSDFFIMNSDMDDLTDSILSAEWTFLLVAPHLEDASEGNLDRIDDVYDYCQMHGYSMYGLTASGRRAIRTWTENTGAEYEFMHCDEIPLQTMVRSNPGMVLLRNGRIVNKWSHLDIPGDDVLTARLDELQSVMPGNDPLRTTGGVVLLFLLPMLAIVLIDTLKRMIL